MAVFVESATVTHGIQLAVAPVFLLTAVSGMIGAVAGRLSRIIDRGRVLEEKLRLDTEPILAPQWNAELAMLRKRGLLANSTIGLLTLCAFMIGLTIVVLFLGETTALRGVDKLAIYAFLAGVSCFMAALCCFFAETLLATRVLKFGQPHED
ncbi:MAG: DUF2721 domain-containing protein [Hylemonella sp.]|uniref:DUF2721 domain-containing protein n=1 Tax=Hylemonella sp. TaxID=2066020 RepID=UPI0022C970BE|nr:DUF2721 domain-containing protein [Hylemonella sp.]MCZ8251303.1 DUF2721 domain-containing protein [Hylemonella sp.]